MGEMGEISIPDVETTYDRTSEIHGRPLRGCRARWIDKKERKESSWV